MDDRLLVDYSSDSSDEKVKITRTELDTIVVKTLLHENLLEVADTFIQEASFHSPIEDLNFVRTRNRIREYIINEDFDAAIKTITENFGEAFISANQRLLFDLEQFKLIYLIRVDFQTSLHSSRQFLRWKNHETEGETFKDECS